MRTTPNLAFRAKTCHQKTLGFSFLNSSSKSFSHCACLLLTLEVHYWRLYEIHSLLGNSKATLHTTGIRHCLKSLKTAFRIKLKLDREICLHFEMQNILKLLLLESGYLKCSETQKKKRYLKVKRRKLKQPKLLQVSISGSGPPAAKHRHGKNINCTDRRESPGAWAQCSRARALQPLAPHR